MRQGSEIVGFKSRKDLPQRHREHRVKTVAAKVLPSVSVNVLSLSIETFLILCVLCVSVVNTLNDFELEPQFFAADDVAQVMLPEFA